VSIRPNGVGPPVVPHQWMGCWSLVACRSEACGQVPSTFDASIGGMVVKGCDSVGES